MAAAKIFHKYDYYYYYYYMGLKNHLLVLAPLSNYSKKEGLSEEKIVKGAPCIEESTLPSETIQYTGARRQETVHA